LSNEEIINTKVVDLEKLYNFVVEHFLIWSHLGPQNMLLRSSLPSVIKKHSAKRVFAECQKKHSAKALFAECKKKTLGKGPLCRVPEKLHSAK
jgi:hypothetical protein